MAQHRHGRDSLRSVVDSKRRAEGFMVRRMADFASMTPPRLPPFRIVTHDTGAGSFCVVLDTAGAVVAQGSGRLCELVAAGHPIFGGQGSLFDDTTAT